jgi:hypothetical protein
LQGNTGVKMKITAVNIKHIFRRECIGLAGLFFFFIGYVQAVHAQAPVAGAPAGAIRLINQDNVAIDGTAYPAGVVPAETLTPAGTKIGNDPTDIQILDTGLQSPSPIDDRGAIFTLFYNDPNVAQVALAVATVDPTAYEKIYTLQTCDLLDKTRTSSIAPYLVGYCMRGLPNGTAVPTTTFPAHVGPPFEADTIRYAARTRTPAPPDPTPPSLVFGGLGSSGGTGADGGNPMTCLANTYSKNSGRPLIGPPAPDYFYPLPDPAGEGNIPSPTKTQPPAPPYPPPPFSPLFPAPILGYGQPVFPGPNPSGLPTPTATWTEQWGIYDGSQNLKASAPIPITVYDKCVVSVTDQVPNNLISGPVPQMTGSVSTWPHKMLNVSFTNLYPSVRVVVIVHQTAPAFQVADYVAKPTNTASIPGTVYADVMQGNVGPPWPSPGQTQLFQFDFARSVGGVMGGLFRNTGTYNIQVWMALPFQNIDFVSLGQVTNFGNGAGSGNANFPTALKNLTPATSRYGNGSVPSTAGVSWYWAQMWDVTFDIKITAGVQGDIITN